MFKQLAAFLSNRNTSAKKTAPKKTNTVKSFHAHLCEQGYTDDEARQVLSACYLVDMGVRCEQGYTFAAQTTTAAPNWGTAAGGGAAVIPAIVPSWSEIFDELFNRRATETVPAFRARLLATATGRTEDEASGCLVTRTCAGIMMLRERGLTLERIMQLPATHYLTEPTHPAAKERYQQYVCSPAHVNGRMLWAHALGLRFG